MKASRGKQSKPKLKASLPVSLSIRGPIDVKDNFDPRVLRDIIQKTGLHRDDFQRATGITKRRFDELVRDNGTAKIGYHEYLAFHVLDKLADEHGTLSYDPAEELITVAKKVPVDEDSSVRQTQAAAVQEALMQVGAIDPENAITPERVAELVIPILMPYLIDEDKVSKAVEDKKGTIRNYLSTSYNRNLLTMFGIKRVRSSENTREYVYYCDPTALSATVKLYQRVEDHLLKARRAMTLAEIGVALNVAPEQIRQALASTSALNKIGHGSPGRGRGRSKIYWHKSIAHLLPENPTAPSPRQRNRKTLVEDRIKQFQEENEQLFGG